MTDKDKKHNGLDMKTLLINNVNSICGSFNSCLNSAWALYQDLQKAGRKSNLCYANISLLRSGVITKNAWFQVDMLDEKEWGDIVDCSVDWNLDFVSAAVYQHISDQLGLKISEQENCALKYAETVTELLKPILATELANRRNKFSTVTFKLGEYMGNYTAL